MRWIAMAIVLCALTTIVAGCVPQAPVAVENRADLARNAATDAVLGIVNSDLPDNKPTTLTYLSRRLGRSVTASDAAALRAVLPPDLPYDPKAYQVTFVDNGDPSVLSTVTALVQVFVGPPKLAVDMVWDAYLKRDVEQGNKVVGAAKGDWRVLSVRQLRSP